MDVHTPTERSRNMRAVRAKDTGPELQIRKALFALGLRYRLHDRSLTGKPDLVFPRFKAVLFVNGCFWHGHVCSLFVTPATNTDFWLKKFGQNRERDRVVVERLNQAGWRTATVWECALRGERKLPVSVVATIIRKWLYSGKRRLQIDYATSLQSATKRAASAKVG